MLKHRRCHACGRQRKESHEKRLGTAKQYHPNCLTYKQYLEFAKEVEQVEAEIKAAQNVENL